MANRHRGEVELELGEGKKILLRPTFEALARIQEVIAPRTFVDFLMDLSANRFSVTDLAKIILAAGVWEEKPTLGEIGEWIAPIGWLEAASKIGNLLTYALVGESVGDEIEDDEEGEAKAERSSPTLSAVTSA